MSASPSGLSEWLAHNERIERENNELLKQLLRRQERAESLRAKVRAMR